jgi:hypothetical protein
MMKLEDIKDKKGNNIPSTPVAQMLFNIKCDNVLEVGDILVKEK